MADYEIAEPTVGRVSDFFALLKDASLFAEVEDAQQQAREEAGGPVDMAARAKAAKAKTEEAGGGEAKISFSLRLDGQAARLHEADFTLQMVPIVTTATAEDARDVSEDLVDEARSFFLARLVRRYGKLTGIRSGMESNVPLHELVKVLDEAFSTST